MDLVTAGIFVGPVLCTVVVLRLSGGAVHYKPLLWAAFAFVVYMSLLRARNVIPVPLFLEAVPLLWIGKIMSLTGTVLLLWWLPGVSFRAAGVVWRQRKGSLPPVVVAGTITIVMASVTALSFSYTPNVTLENLLFQATLPGLDEELFMRGLLLLLLHQAFGKSFRVWGADTGWAMPAVALIFGLLHGVAAVDGTIQVNVGAIVSTTFVGLMLTWMRERTGSLLLPVLFHNLFNVAQAFV